jgi:mono/diheme cytochrome c family protein
MDCIPLEYPKLRRRSAIAVVALAVALAACRQDMHDAPRYEPFEASTFFTDGRASRPLVPNTVARGQLREDEHLYTGKVGGQLVTEFPMPVTEAVMARGQERFNVFCAPCHSRTGEGTGMIVQRGFRQPPSYYEERLVNAPVGYLFDVMTNGFGAMPDYRAQISPRDRWNIVAYIRALQLSQHAQRADIPGGDPTKVKPPAASGSTGPGRH